MAWAVLASLSFICLCSAVSAKREFTVAVFEHRHRHDDYWTNTKQIVAANLNFYEKAARLAVEKGADIIIFNEYGLFPYRENRTFMNEFTEDIPDPQQGIRNPCMEDEFKDHQILSALSCIARKHKTYVVGNLGDRHDCQQSCDAAQVDGCDSKCPDDGILTYNTDVAFDREGNLVSRYHKVHPYFENVNSGKSPGYISFETDFGTFGMVVCFDLVWKESVDLAQKIDNLIFPTFWFDDIVPFQAVEFQQSWALANNVNLISANAQYPGWGTLGTGIYSKDSGAVVYTYEPDGASKLLVGKLGSKEKKPGMVYVVTESGHYVKEETGKAFPENCYEKLVGPAKDMYNDYRCFKAQVEDHILVKLEQPKGEVSACDRDFCCSLSYVTDGINDDFYLAVRNFTNDVKGFYHWEEETCLVVRCDPFEGKPCVLFPSTSKTTFKAFELRGKFTADRVYPTVSKTRQRLAPKQEWSFKTSAEGTVLKFQSNCKAPLLKAGLFGRCYQRDTVFVPWF